MRSSRFTPEQVAMALRQAESGTPVSEICRKLEVTENTFYRWKRKFGGLGTPEWSSGTALMDLHKAQRLRYLKSCSGRLTLACVPESLATTRQYLPVVDVAAAGRIPLACKRNQR